MILTRRQREVLDFVREHFERHGYAPTLAEIGRHLGLRSPATVHKHVQHLVRKGYLRKAPHQGRGVEPAEHVPPPAVEVPLLGELTAGRPVDPLATPEILAVPPRLVGRRPTFALRVRGGSLQSASIREGDLLLIEERDDPDDGSMVLAADERGAIVVGSYESGPVSAGIVPAGPLAPLERRPLGEVGVRGVVVGLIRDYAGSSPPRVSPPPSSSEPTEPPRSDR